MTLRFIKMKLRRKSSGEVLIKVMIYTSIIASLHVNIIITASPLHDKDIEIILPEVNI